MTGLTISEINCKCSHELFLDRTIFKILFWMVCSKGIKAASGCLSPFFALKTWWPVWPLSGQTGWWRLPWRYQVLPSDEYTNSDLIRRHKYQYFKISRPNGVSVHKFTKDCPHDYWHHAHWRSKSIHFIDQDYLFHWPRLMHLIFLCLNFMADVYRYHNSAHLQQIYRTERL